jgi:hypothetical protein
MLKKYFYSLLFLILFPAFCSAQEQGTVNKLLRQDEPGMGQLVIRQDPGIDSLINRYILYNRHLGGIEGYRIQIYSSSDKNAREESGKARAEFISKFPDIISYGPTFEKPGYYKIRVGDYMSKIEGTKYLQIIRRVFPDAYLVPCIINFPDQRKN